MTCKIKPIILCGGSGTRLWPLSRESFPKQFVPLIDGKSLLNLTIERVKELTEAVGEAIGYQGKIIFDVSKPDGAPKKLMNSNRLEGIGWKASINLIDGLKIGYEDFLSQGQI